MKVSVLLIFAFVAATSAHKCFPVKEFCKGRHQEYSRCNANPSCQLTCENPVGPRPCTKNCVEGCVCKKGYVEDKERNCVKVEACPIIEPICSAAEHKRFTDCGANPICQKTCGNLDRELACPYSCEPGCICESGYVQDSNGNCIKPEECPAIQPICELAEHKIYTECNAICPIKTCENPDGELFCPAICRSGCVCESGYVQDSNGNCIKLEECPTIQPICEISQHEVYSECGAYCQRGCGLPTPCAAPPQDCNPGCVCEAGYVRNSENICIKEEECQPICELFEHKIYTECNAICPIKTCENPDGEFICPLICISGCVCEDGYLQDKDGNCILPETCPQKAVPAICLFPQETGPCRAYIPSWGYNSETKGCTEFIYGGCQGNSNRFESQEECNSTCM